MYLERWVAVSVLVTSFVAANSHVLHEKRNTPVSNEWIRRDIVDPDLTMPVRVGMNQNNLDIGAKLLMDISSPSSSNYGQHLSAAEVHALFAPSTDTVQAILSWLSTNLPKRRLSQSVNKQWVQLEASSEELARLFRTQYYVWEHLPSGRHTVACDEYSVPHHLKEHIDYITPGIKLHMPAEPGYGAKKLKTGRNLSTPVSSSRDTHDDAYKPKPQPFHGFKYCAHEMTPQCIQALYNVTNSFVAAEGNDIGVYASGADRYQDSVLKVFFEKLYPKIPSDTKPKTLFIDNTPFIAPQDGELGLDIQMAYPLIYPQNLTIWYVDDKYNTRGPAFNKTTHNYNPTGFFNTWLDAIDGSYCNYTAYGITGDSPGIDPTYPDHRSGGWDHPLQCGVYKPTNVMTISYYEAESWLPVRYLKRQCNEFMKLGLQGVSIFFCSGDTGAGGGGGSPYPNSENSCQGKNPRDVFDPNFPASCPWVTGVGATKLPVNSSIFDHPEVTSLLSSGGFSNIWAIPEYQKKAVTQFLTKFPPGYKSYSTKDEKDIGANGGRYNRNGRGFPDVSAVGEYVVITTRDGEKIDFTWAGGTSAAAPIVAGLFTRINAARLKAGKKPVGFVNPTLVCDFKDDVEKYAHPEAFNDVTQGKNRGCRYNDFGYQAQEGWDPVTGLGSPDYGKLEELFLAMP